MRNHLDSIVAKAIEEVDSYYSTNKTLCDFSAEIYQGPYYSTPHGQAWYLLRYYPAYYAEYHLMYTALSNLGVKKPHIVSLGCGNLVDAAAAEEVFGTNLNYIGYDKENWSIKACGQTCSQVDLSKPHTFPADTNVLCFPRSLGDLTCCYQTLATAVTNSKITSDVIYVCASLRVAGEKFSTAGDEANLLDFLSLLQEYKQIGDVNYHPAQDSAEKEMTIDKKIHGWWHNDPNYAKKLVKKCKEASNCEKTCEVKSISTLKLNNIAYTIRTLQRVN